MILLYDKVRFTIILYASSTMQQQPSLDLDPILLQVSQGNEQAFNYLFERYYNQVYTFIFPIAGSEALTQEIVQDIFMKLWANRSQLVEVRYFKSYLLTIARNHAFNCLKQIARVKKKEKIWVEDVLKQAIHNTEESDNTDYHLLIDAAIAQLPAQQQKIYTLSRVDKMKQAEIADKLGLSLETVKKHMVLALRFIKNNLSQSV